MATTAVITAGLWDASTRQRLLLLYTTGERPLSASFDASGDALLVAEADGSLSRYACEVCGGVEELLALADRRLAATGRELTAEERRHYLAED